MHPRAVRTTGFLSLLTIIALVLHASNIGSRSLWLDEGFTLMRIFGSWSDLIRNTVYWNGVRTTDTNPQVYFAALKFWSILAGRGEFALQWFSAMGGVLFVATSAALARWTFSARAGVVAALAAALSPLAAWYAVELRMYSWVVNLAAIGILLLLRLLERPSFGRFLAWTAASAAALATHYSFIGMILTHVVIAALPLLRTRRLRPVHWIVGVVASSIALAVVAVVIDAPALWARFRAGAEYSYEFKPLYDVIGSIASGALFGVNQRDPSGGWLSWLFVVVWAATAIGVLVKTRAMQSRALRVRVLVASTIGPVLVWYALSLVKPNFAGVRHLMLMLPPLLAVLAGGIDYALQRTKLALLPAALLAAANLYGLLGVVLPGAEKQDDWRSVARTIRVEWQAGDLVVANSGTPREVVQGYLGDLPAPVISVVGIDLAEVNRARRIWYLNTGAVDATPDRGLDWVRALNLHQSYRFPGRTNTIELLLLSHDASFDALPADAIAVAPEYAGAANDDHIVGWQMLPTNPYAPAANMQVRLFWRRGVGPSVDRTLSFRLRSGDETVLDESEFGRLPVHAAHWTPGRLVAVDYAIALPLGLPPLPYVMEIVAYDGSNGRARQTVHAPLSAQQVSCCVRHLSWSMRGGSSSSPDVIRYLPPSAVAKKRGIIFDEALVSVEHAATALPGRFVFLGASWNDVDGAWTQGATLATLAGEAVAESSAQAPVPGLAAAAWPKGELVRTTIAVRVPDDAVGGWYRLSAWRDHGRGRERTYVGVVRVVDYAMAPPAAAGEFQSSIDGRAGEWTLLGVSVDRPLQPGCTCTVSTFWRVDARPARDGVIFVHIVGPDGALIVQEDHPPENGTRSTRTFRAGAGHREENTFTIPTDLKPGKYTAFVGIYDRDDLQRWPAVQNGTSAKDDLIAVGEFTVKP